MNNCYGQKLNLLAVSIANALSEGLSDDEINLLAGLLQLVGEALAVIPASKALCGRSDQDEGAILK
ncbi:hypothetical protein [Ruminococcus sp. Marseille-P6503]|uniref:hypothetical protein n=1 Tax=Ruminococcus sp. Marseille-P6503 TaxID=2364796 RepID=UPI000F53D2E2|nr:hypothetical protein [Ruminococcus sp. Marseille-P6503]